MKWEQDDIIMYGHCRRLKLRLVGGVAYVELHSDECQRECLSNPGWALSATHLGFDNRPLMAGSQSGAKQEASRMLAERLSELADLVRASSV